MEQQKQNQIIMLIDDLKYYQRRAGEIQQQLQLLVGQKNIKLEVIELPDAPPAESDSKV